MVVTCQILLQKSKEGVFRSGQPVIGTLKYNIDKPTKFTSIDISLRGKGKCEWTETYSNTTRYYSNTEEYVNIFKNLLTDQNDVSGTYEHPFEFYLPENIPTSMKNTTCKIEYRVVVTFVRDNFLKTKYKFDAEVLVYGYVSPCSPEPLIFGLQKNLISLTSNNNIDIKAEIEKTFLTPGENIKLNLMINNDTDVPIAIKAELVKYFTYLSEDKTEKIDKEVLKTTEGYFASVKERSVSSVNCIVPTLPNLYSIQHTKIMTGEYKVRVTARIPFPHTNAVVEIPVVIGERSGHAGYEFPSSSKLPYVEYVEKDAKNPEDFFEKHEINMKDFQDKM
ncbi:hypothetical protein PYW07_002015 [Mythimna separata]|uniref:Arrestin C-terminal-like domain-containing protein n=1 Tax=Mythimna separata TaxID=271217 RepID=A0AAD8DT08_MYTSE|nr:hypothetical protein PYW07_002015 [Mythimna separata]